MVYIKKNEPKPQETLDRTLYKSSTEQLHTRAVEDRIKHNLTSCYHGVPAGTANVGQTVRGLTYCKRL